MRFRHDELGDIGRVQRQQAVLRALLHTVLQPQTLAKLPALLKVAQANIDTDLSVEELLALTQAAFTTNREQSNFMMLPGRFSQAQEYPLSYWLPDPQAAMPMLSCYFGVSSFGSAEAERSA